MTPCGVAWCIISVALLLTYGVAALCNFYHDAQPEIDAHTFMAHVDEWIAEEMEKRQ